MKTIPFDIPVQPNDETCGIACLSGVYRYWQMPLAIETLMKDVPMLESGGTLGVNLGTDALKRGFDVELTTYNLQVFDPSWAKLGKDRVIEKLNDQIAAKSADKKLTDASRAYMEFLALGGEIKFGDVSVASMSHAIDCGNPIIVGLSSTYLYQSMREIPETTALDDIRGYPAGHFVVINGYDRAGKHFSVCDPYHGHPFGAGQTYCVQKDHLLTSIFLGIVTYDANFMVVKPKAKA